jgi:hypothetical protein
MTAVKFTFDVNKIAEASHDANVIITPMEGPNTGVDCELRSASERSWNLALAGDHVMGANNIGPVAVAHTEAKPTASVGGMNPREWRRLVEFMGRVTAGFKLTWIINRPGLTTDTYEFYGCIMTGDAGEERNTGSLPVTSFEVLITVPCLNGINLLTGERYDPAA